MDHPCSAFGWEEPLPRICPRRAREQARRILRLQNFTCHRIPHHYPSSQSQPIQSNKVKKKKALTSPPSLSQCPDAQARHDHCSRSHSLARSGAPQYAGCAPRRGCCCAGAAAPGPSSTWAPAGPSCCRRSGGRRCACRRWWRGRWESRPAARPRRPSRSSPTRRRRRARTSW